LQNTNDLGGAAYHGQAFPLGTDHSKSSFLREASADHLLISIFENVQRQRCLGKQHYLQREQGDLHALAIMLAFYALRPGVKALVLIPRDRSGFTITVSGPA
jgi:hypothetical protein